MARYTGPNCKECRREGCKLYLKGERCTNGKCAFDHRSTAPGQHGAARKKVGEYGKQLREKQKTRRYYGVLEGQFRHYYELAEKMDVQLCMPPLKLCGDNAAMIGSQAYYEYLAGNVAGMDLNAYATKSILGEAL